MSRSDKRANRIGQQFITNEGYKIIIIEYNNCNDLLVQFQDEHKAIVPSKYYYCQNKTVPNPYHPSTCGLGYIGVGIYKPKINGKQTIQHKYWHNMFTRCYYNKEVEKHPTYKIAFINKCWYNFQNFGEWFDNNYYEIEGEKMCLDKDILVKGNKEYAPDKCIFVPERINILFIKRDNDRGDYPIGVSYHKASGKYMARCSIKTENGNKEKYLGSYNTPEEAFLAYKEFKEAYIKQVADEYKERIPKRLYEALYKYEVEITD